MKLCKIVIKNFRGYKFAELADLGDINSFIGKNDSGKSTILEAISIFLDEKYKINIDDFYLQKEDECYIEIWFSEYPNFVTTNDVKIQLLKSGYIHSNGYLIIRKVFTNVTEKGLYTLVTSDFSKEEYQNLIGMKENLKFSHVAKRSPRK